MDERQDEWEFEKLKTYGTGYGVVSVKCPYFRNHGKTEVHCESAYGKDAVMIMRFREPETKNRHMKIWCEGDYRKCEWYRQMMALYDPEG